LSSGRNSNTLSFTFGGKYFEVAEKDDPEMMTWDEAMDKYGRVESEEKGQLAICRDALHDCLEAMKERRGYAAAWEYKYSARWDTEDKMVEELIGGEE
jgi:hypothetical protein